MGLVGIRRSVRYVVVAALLSAAVGLPASLVPRASAAPQPPERSPTPGAGREVDLRPRFTAGEELKYVMNLENDGSTEMPGVPASKQTSRQQIEFRLKTISSDPEKGSTVELIYDSLQIHIDAGENKVDFDSRKPAATSPARKTPGKPATNKPSTSKPAPAKTSPSRSQPGQKARPGSPAPATTEPEPDLSIDPLAEPADPTESLVEALKPIVGSKLTLTVAPDGSITQVTGGSELSSALVGRYAGPITDPQGVKDLFGPIFSVRNAKASARVGEKWQHADTLDLALLGKLRLTTDHTLKSASGGKATVDFRGTIGLDSEATDAGQAFRLTDTRYEGSYIWDTDRGSLDAMQQVQSFTLAGDMEGASIKVKNNGRVKIERQRR